MKNFTTVIFILAFFCISTQCTSLYGQQATAHAKNGMTAGNRNYTSFTVPFINTSAEAIKNNAGYEQHPETGKLFAETPCDNCYELIGKRTENSKTFIKEGTQGRKIMQQTSNAPMHYHDANGNWITIKTQLQPDNKNIGVYAATEQEIPVSINTTNKFVSLGKTGQAFQFNHNLELVFAKPDGSEVSLGNADWTHYTAGDDGVYVTNAWPGMDIEIFVIRGSVKTNFWINKAMPAYSGGQLLVRDHLHLDGGLSMVLPQGKVKAMDSGPITYTGNVEITNNSGDKLFTISAATAFEKKAINSTLKMLEYHINDDVLDIALPGDFLNRPASSYPIIIDPLVSTATISSVSGSSYSPSWTIGCVYTNPATVPAYVTISDVQFSFQYVTSGGALLNNGAFDFKLGTCRSPTPTALFWNCNSLLAGTCTGTGASIFSSIFPCVPAPQCLPYNLNLTMNFYQDYLTTSPCSNLYISAGTPLTITVFGNTIDPGGVSASASPVCQGQPTILSTTALNGVPPYTYVWTPGSFTGASVTLTPSATTTYTVTSTDACGNTTTATKTITVNPVSPISGATSVCTGATATLSDAITGGTWSSSNTSIATIGSATGIAAGIATGTATITYTTATGCNITATLTVLPPPPAITGTNTVCQGSTTTLSDATTGGTWTSGNASIATIGALSGTAAGISGGTAIITYTSPGGCFALTTLTVNPDLPITGSATVCVGGNTTLVNPVSGGTWTSSNPAVATIVASSGIVTGVSIGNSTITYTTPAGCTSTFTINVNLLTPITGSIPVCPGSNITLSNSTTGGTWTSGNISIATVTTSTGIVTGVSGGTTSITYTVSSGCYSTITVTVYPLAPITGPTAVCVGSTIQLSDATTGGSWSSTNVAAATIDPVLGIVTGIASGATTIKYTTITGCIATTTVTVNALFPITGTTTVCQGSATILSNLTPSGTWTSGNTAIATINVLGVTTGIAPGTTIITYTTPGGCYATTTLTVIPISPITGTSVICQGTTTTLSDGTPGGTWSSSNTSVAIVGLTTGVATGLSGGTSIIQYTTTSGCVATLILTVNPLAPITGITTVCQGYTTTLSDAIASGTWTSGNPGIASIGISSGITTGVSGGTSFITYTTGSGCIATTIVTVNPLAPIAGITTVCQGYTTILSDATPGGTWSSSNATVATISTTGIVTGISNGFSIIQYTTTAGCIATVTVNVNPLTPITGSTSICTTTTLSDATPGGTWSSSTPAVAGIGLSSGIVTAISPGTSAITYTTIGGCFTTITLTVNPTPPITGVTTLCAGNTATMSNAVTGGIWSSSNPAIATIGISSGIVTGLSGGMVTITYTTPAGCLATINFFVMPLGPITGVTTVCQGSTTTLSDAATGGTWSSTSPAVASVGVATGVARGLTAGTTTIKYTTAAGCIATTTVTVNPLAPITGTTNICQGFTTNLYDATPGGTWSSGNSAIATINAITGLVNGLSAGTVTMSYTTSAGCIATTTVLINALAPITGSTTVCQGYTTTLSNAASGGTWSSTTPPVAAIGITTGVVTGIAAGTAYITYVTSAGCIAAITVTVNPLATIAGTASVCAGNTTKLSDATIGGTWSSANTAVAKINTVTGIATGLTAGTTIINYTTNLGCVTSVTLSVNAFPSVITGTTSVCIGSTTTLSNALSGGTWTSGNPAVAAIGITTGIVTGVTVNTAIITYTTTGSCSVMTTITVNPLPLAITGTTSVCETSTTLLSDATPAGIWSSTTPGIATVNPATGLVTGVLAGITTIIYTTPAGCTAKTVFTVNPVPATITGTKTVCEGATSMLFNTLAGGAWSSANTSIAVIGATTGAFIGASTGTAIISYITPSGCFAVTAVIVNPTPVIKGASFTNPATCVTNDGTITLTGLTAGESYTVNYTYGSTPVTTTISANGTGNLVITNLAIGSYTNISVTTTLGCTSNVIGGPLVLINPPTPGTPAAKNNTPICEGSEVDFTATDATAGVTYSWTGPGGFTSSVQNPVISNAQLISAGTYTVTAIKLGCISAPVTTVVVIHPVPKITAVSFTNPKTCFGGDGTITLSGLVAGITYAVTYVFNDIPSTINLTANTAGQIIINGLSSGTYSSINVMFSCVSNTIASVTLTDPFPAPAPTLWSNSPICSASTLRMTATDAVKNLTYEWVGPNGFTSTDQNPVIENISMADSGLFTLTIKYLNCPSTASQNIIVYPPLALTNVTPSQGIPLGSSIQLYVSGALFYTWSPNDGTLSNPNIDSPVATPQGTTTYVVTAMNTFGCIDSAKVTLSIDDNITEFMPNAFSPNNDGKNDVFKIGNIRSDKLLQFNVYNRWGQLIYHNSSDPNQGWDGTFNGVAQDIGTYNYSIILETPAGKTKEINGSVILIR